ncbi:MAG TPA: hypothetical protein VNB90_00340 [Cytophagaceae bacterium]|jgi:hypothetical protein|nr:hypothetical protein [Cytophagaceae bacterium]
MKKLKNGLALLALVSLFVSCKQEKKNYNVEGYLSKDAQEQELVQIRPYISKLEYGVNYNNRFSDTNKTFFDEQQKIYKFNFEQYYINNDSVHYFLIWKVAPSLYAKKIAIGGKYKKDANGKIYAFQEIFNTPKMKLDELKEKSYSLFDYMVENGNVDKFFGDYELVEFPDGRCLYDTTGHKWILTQNPRWDDHRVGL